MPGETFRLLEEKEEKQLGEYRTCWLVVEAYDRLAKDFEERPMNLKDSGLSHQAEPRKSG